MVTFALDPSVRSNYTPQSGQFYDPRFNQAVVGPLTLQGPHPAKEKRNET